MNKLRLSILLVSIIALIKPVVAQEFIVGDTLSTHVTFSDIPDTSLPLNFQSVSEFNIDIDKDQLFDIKFTRAHISGQISWHIWHFVLPMDSIQFVCDISDFNADTLSKGSIIDNSLNWEYNSSGARLFEVFNSIAPPPSYEKGLFKKDSLYLGFRKIYEGDTLYGWFCLECTSSSLVIRSFATNRNYSSIQDYQSKQELKIYPNPANNILYIESTIKLGIIRIYSPDGTIHFQKQIDPAINQIDVSKVSNGIYFIVLESDDHSVGKSFIKQ